MINRNPYIPGTYTNIAMQTPLQEEIQQVRMRMAPQEIRINCEISIANDPADQKSILEFMEK